MRYYKFPTHPVTPRDGRSVYLESKLLYRGSKVFSPLENFLEKRMGWREAEGRAAGDLAQ